MHFYVNLLPRVPQGKAIHVDNYIYFYWGLTYNFRSLDVKWVMKPVFPSLTLRDISSETNLRTAYKSFANCHLDVFSVHFSSHRGPKVRTT